MRCMKSDQIIAYLDDQLSLIESRELEAHIERCPFCTANLQGLIESDDEASAERVELLIPDTFTQDVLQKIERLEHMPSLNETTPIPNSINWKARSVLIMKKMTIAVAGLTVTIAVGTFVSPTFANYVNSLFQHEQKVDNGMIEAGKHGFTTPLGLKVTDQQITFAVKEVLADPLRIAVLSELTDQNGKRLDKDRIEEVDVKLTDEKGKAIFDEDGGYSFKMQGDYVIIKQELTELIARNKKIPDSMQMEIAITMIDGKAGNWNIVVPIDMKKSKAASKTVKINQQYQTSSGVVVDLRRADFVPSGTLVSLDLKATAQRTQQIKDLIRENGLPTTDPKAGEWSIKHDVSHALASLELAYTLRNEKGEVVAAWDDLDTDGLKISKNTIINGITGEGEDNYISLFHSFLPLKEKALTFTLEKVYSHEPAAFAQHVSLSALTTKPMETDYEGNRIAFTDYLVKTDKKEVKVNDMPVRETGSVIAFTAQLAHDVVDVDGWQAMDKDGRTYDVEVTKNAEWTKDGNVSMTGLLILPDLPRNTKELTLTYAMTMKQHKEHWEVPIHIQE